LINSISFSGSFAVVALMSNVAMNRLFDAREELSNNFNNASDSNVFKAFIFLIIFNLFKAFPSFPYNCFFNASLLYWSSYFSNGYFKA